MATHRIVCTEQSDPGAVGHGHIVAVGVGDNPSKATSRVTVLEVRRQLSDREIYYTSDANHNVALVEPFDCSCGINTIRSTSDATTANNLDRLRICHWT